jgi:hypothetical protein
MTRSEHSGETTVGERLLRSTEVANAAASVEAEVQVQLMAALQGPIGTALAASHASSDAGASGANHADAQALLGAEVPRRFIGAGAALTIAYMGISEGDEIKTAGALLCAQRLLFPDDPLGAVAVGAVTRSALEALESAEGDHPDPTPIDSAAAMQTKVAGGVEALERVYLQAGPHLETAALSTYSWKQATGGAGPSSSAVRSRFGPFLDGLIRWAFYVEAALQGIRLDDWARTGAALIAARRVTGSG